MDAQFILDAIRRAHPDAAVVPEVVIHDHLWDERRAEAKPIRRIDALMVRSLQRTAIEVKVSLADWKRDTYRKRAPWVAVVNRFVFAVPKSLHDQIGGNYGMHQLDTWDCGVWTVDENGRVEVVKKAKVRPHPEPLPQQVVQTLAFRAARAALTEKGDDRATHGER
ncbi:hypothetical protein [Microbacterium album]|uniref:Uncharacterized protein n=1 Tax=Microbacterium album TaxID=2053191 RepID=A0A917IB27_9MICO|nr:hypothetical protein [Microbacterium album]GGH34118.1 hypothetical protein GCM10010921_01570 [Microbacterium album]